VPPPGAHAFFLAKYNFIRLLLTAIYGRKSIKTVPTACRSSGVKAHILQTEKTDLFGSISLLFSFSSTAMVP
jgi:hypothetical protein